MNRPIRTILHVDLDAFFASVEQRDQPELRGKPVLVGGSVARGVVAAASYEARRYGVHSAMPMAEAMRRCPHAIVVRHRPQAYGEASSRFFSILSDYSPLVEGLSVDEAFVDVTGCFRLHGDGATIARSIKARVADELELVASVGVAPTKFAAKIGSDIDKPDGLRVIEPDRLLAFLHPLPVSRLWGVGAVTQKALADLGLNTIGDVARYPREVLCRRLGQRTGEHLAQLASGEDPREVHIDGEPVSIGHEETFDRDIAAASELLPYLLDQCDRVAARLRRASLRARVVVLKIKYADFRSITRRRTLDQATCDGRALAQTIRALLAAVAVGPEGGKRTRVRLCGVAVSGLVSADAPTQLLLDQSERERGERLGHALDRVHERFGKDALGRAITRK